MSQPRDPASFARIQAALGGARFDFDPAASKMVRLMIEDHRGCDAVITDDDFVIQYGSGSAVFHYVLRSAPGVISKLLELAGVTCKERLRTMIGPATLQMVGSPLTWSFSRRRVWIAATPTRIVVQVREAVSDDEEPDALPPAGEQPMTFVELHTGCPHCRVFSPSYRMLGDGALVCAACGRSFTR